MIKKLNEVPLDNRLIILEDEAPAKRASGIILEGEARIKPYTGTIVVTGPEVKTLKPKDRVRYAVRAGDKITIDEQDYLILRETDIYTKLTK